MEYAIRKGKEIIYFGGIREMVFNYDDFKQIMKSASKFTSNDEDRPRLTYIKFTVKDNKLKVESLDGYRALRFTRKLADNNEDFTAF